jgi:NAD(P) transhydrogenase subunit alpha
MITIYVPKESQPGETRVAATPETVKRLVGDDLRVQVRQGAGASAYLDDDQYREAGAEIVADSSRAAADIVLSVAPPTPEQIAAMRPSALAVSFFDPSQNLDTVRSLRDHQVNAIAMELIPRITRAQSMDALSSQASLGGYKAVLMAAANLPSYFPLLMTAAGTIKPARVVIMGAGVAGLQAIATAKRLGAVVEVSDIRPAVQEQVESLGGRFIALPMEETGEGQGGYAKEMGEDFLKRQREIVAQHIAHADVVITTAQIPGKKAPILVPQEMVESMRAGSVIIDLAVTSGGNCTLSRVDEEVVHQGVRVFGPANIAATMPRDASVLYARNVQALLHEVFSEGKVSIDLDNDVVGPALLVFQGEVRHALTAELL